MILLYTTSNEFTRLNFTGSKQHKYHLGRRVRQNQLRKRHTAKRDDCQPLYVCSCHMRACNKSNNIIVERNSLNGNPYNTRNISSAYLRIM